MFFEHVVVQDTVVTSRFASFEVSQQHKWDFRWFGIRRCLHLYWPLKVKAVRSAETSGHDYPIRHSHFTEERNPQLRSLSESASWSITTKLVKRKQPGVYITNDQGSLVFLWLSWSSVLVSERAEKYRVFAENRVVGEKLERCHYTYWCILFSFFCRDVVLNGFKIPKNTQIVPLLHAVHMDPNLWDEPEKFKPTRFLNAEGKVTKPEYFLPFGVGKQNFELKKKIYFHPHTNSVRWERLLYIPDGSQN